MATGEGWSPLKLTLGKIRFLARSRGGQRASEDPVARTHPGLPSGLPHDMATGFPQSYHLGRKPQSSHNLISEVTSHYFRHILFLRGESVSPHMLRGGDSTEPEARRRGPLVAVLEAAFPLLQEASQTDLPGPLTALAVEL